MCTSTAVMPSGPVALGHLVAEVGTAGLLADVQDPPGRRLGLRAGAVGGHRDHSLEPLRLLDVVARRLPEATGDSDARLAALAVSGMGETGFLVPPIWTPLWTRSRHKELGLPR